MPSKDYFYDTIASKFDSIMNMYDTKRRAGVIFDDFLGSDDLSNKTFLDAGCGTGFFSLIAIEKGAIVTSLDIAPSLVELTKKKNDNINGVVGSLLELPFESNVFDYVISSDVIEHTPDPYKCINELVRVLKPGGKLCVTVPNRTFWYFSVLIANKLKIRKYQGYENWVHFNRLKKVLSENSIEIIDYKGIHLFPFVLNLLNPFLYRIDKILEYKAAKYMVNIAAYGIKRAPELKFKTSFHQKNICF